MKRLLLPLICFAVAAVPLSRATTYFFEGLGEKGSFAQGSFEVAYSDIPDASGGTFRALRSEISEFAMTLERVPATPNSKTYTQSQFGDLVLAKLDGELAMFSASTSSSSNSFTYWVWGDGYPFTSSGVFRITSTATYSEDERLDTIHWSIPTPEGSPRNQVIVARAADSVPANASPFSITASASSGLPVSLGVVEGPATISDGKVVLTGEQGSLTIQVSQSGGVARGQTYLAAQTIELTIEVGEPVELEPQVISFPSLPNRVLGAPPFSVTATASSGLPVSVSVISGPASITGKLLTLTGATGTVILQATQTGGEKNGIYYAAAAPEERSFQVLAASPSRTQTINFPQPPSATYGDAVASLSATASSGLPVTFELVSGPASLSGSSLSFIGAGRVVVRALQAGNEEFKAAAPVLRTIAINKAPLVVTFLDTSRLVRAANPSFVPVFTGFVGNDTAEDLDILPVGATTAKSTSAQGIYPILPRGGTDNNYRFVAGTPGKLTVLGFGGAYESLLRDDRGTPRGKLTLAVSTNSLSFTGQLDLAAEPAAVAIAGTLDPESEELASGVWSRAKTGLAKLDVTFVLTGDTLDVRQVQRDQVEYAAFKPELLGARVYSQKLSGKRKLPAPWMGSYTLVSRAAQSIADQDLQEIPHGAGYAAASVAASGAMSLRGRLADGALLTASARASEVADEESPTGFFPVWVRPYGKRADSFFAGIAELTMHVDQTRFPLRYYQPEGAHLFYWAKAQAASDTVAPAGFAVDLATGIDPWIAPVAKPTSTQPSVITVAQRLRLSEIAENVSVSIDYLDVSTEALGARATQVPTSLVLQTNNTFALPSPESSGAAANPTGFMLKLSPSTGALEGSFVLSDIVPPATKATLRKVMIYGTLRQGPDLDAPVGHGFILLPQLGSSVRRSFEFRISRGD